MKKIKLFILLIICAFITSVNAQIITTIAGTATVGGYGAFGGDGGPATNAQFARPTAIAIDSIGNIYIADEDNFRIRKINMHDTVYTIAGTGISGYIGDSIPASVAQICDLSYIWLLNDRNLYITDVCNNRIRKINLITDTITTVAGNGTSYCIDSGFATAASINYPFGVTFDTSGNLYLSDACDFIDKINSDRIISRVAGSDSVDGYGGDNGPATDARLNHPVDIAIDKEGNLYISDAGNNVIRKVDTSGTITNYAGTAASSGYFGDQGLATDAQLDVPEGIITDGAGNVFFSDCGNNAVRRIDHETHIITTVAGNGTEGFSGDGFPATDAQLFHPAGLAFDRDGNLYIADWLNNRIRKVTNLGVPERVKSYELGVMSGVNVYPNPVRNEVTIDGAANCEISIRNIIGQSIIKLTIQKNKEAVDVSKLSNGIYLVEILDATTGIKTVKKILKE